MPAATGASPVRASFSSWRFPSGGLKSAPNTPRSFMKPSRLRYFLFVFSFLPILLAVAAPAAQAAIDWKQLFPIASPPARSYLAMAYDIASEKVVVFGGFDGRGYLRDTWTFDGWDDLGQS